MKTVGYFSDDDRSSVTCIDSDCLDRLDDAGGNLADPIPADWDGVEAFVCEFCQRKLVDVALENAAEEANDAEAGDAPY
jgi:hypothetical protein